MADAALAPSLGDSGRIPLSLQQEFLRMIDHGDETGPFGSRYTIVGGWRILGPIDVDALQGALDDVVVRHESLRTVIVRDDGIPYQTVLPASSPTLTVRDLDWDGDREVAEEDFLNAIEAEGFSIHEMPLLQAVLGRFDEESAVLALIAHHTAVDGWSIHRIIRDVAAYYVARRKGTEPVLPEVHQYREYVEWQQGTAESPALQASRDYWRDNLRGAQVTPIRSDLTRSEEPFVTGWHRFLIEDEYLGSVNAVAVETRSSPFMVLLAVYLMYLNETTGRTDLVVPTFMPGRQPSWVEETVGSFYNFVPLRVDVAGASGLTEVISRVRKTCLSAYAHEIPFGQLLEEAPDVMTDALGANAAACAFQVTQSPFMMHDQPAADLRFTAIRRRVVSAPMGSQIPDGLLWGLEVHPDGGIVGSIGYTTNLFVEESVAAMADDFRGTLLRALLFSELIS
ncbi:hypothetical protein F4553_003447 [Allocatelliglobosispora scoriae]|uniref:Condensation domain-containing protein n=1 Tax=Allocatelliglobosispora scoriae TaxID=643052 RepID=A0A841BRP3_9ACTN|nr:condensation domain-containing protein [Allocatelliglobosispora scoriae]MBB5870068.1 hypothetical protein [Allocatelliglobosispora scoriae]